MAATAAIEDEDHDHDVDGRSGRVLEVVLGRGDEGDLGPHRGRINGLLDGGDARIVVADTDRGVDDCRTHLAVVPAGERGRPDANRSRLGRHASKVVGQQHPAHQLETQERTVEAGEFRFCKQGPAVGR